MLRDKRFRLVTLGRLTLVGAAGEEDASLARRRLKLAVLAVLALARRPVPRDTLLGLFWAEHDETRARHSLSNALSSLRGALGERSITTRDADVALDPDAPLDVDAIEIGEAIEAGDHARVVELYSGPFLEGFHVDESPAFEQWASRERRRLESLFIRSCAEYCATLARARRWRECEAVASRWVETEPLSADAAIYYLNAIKAPGTRSALASALEEYEALRTRLHHEFDLAPHPSIVELSGRIREQLANAPPEPVVNVRVTQETKIETLAAPDTKPGPVGTQAPTSLRHHAIRLGIAAVAVTALLAIGTRLFSRRDASTQRPSVAVLSLPMRSDDTSLTWLSEGLPQMIHGKLASVPAIDVVPAPQVRAVIRRSGRAPGSRIADSDARDLARRVGASLVAHGTLAHDGQSFVLDLSLHDVTTGELIRNAILTDADPLTLADQAAARILSAADVSTGGPRFADVETSSLAAYQHYMRATLLGQEGRFTAAIRELDASITLDSGFIPALRSRLALTPPADTALARRIRQKIQEHWARATEFDRLEQELWDSFYAGERERSEALARGLVRRYPRDPRAYQVLHTVLSTHGEFVEAERAAVQGLALDSLAMRAGSGPCSQCVSFFTIINLHWLRSDWTGAAAWARRWIAEQPDAPSSWSTLAWTYAYSQQPDSALAVSRRAVTLSGNERWAMDQYARLLMVNRRYAAAESVTARLEQLHGDSVVAEAADLRSLLAREYGRPGESDSVMAAYATRFPPAAAFTSLIHADNRRLQGDHAGAYVRYEALSHTGPAPQEQLPLDPGSARAFCWHHALGADALGVNADTVLLSAIADTLQAGCTRSYYGRDWKLHHHVRGLVAMRAGRFADAEREFEAAVWTPIEGWPRTTVELARARMALGRPLEAVEALRTAYATRLDAMGRYVPISELDFWMSRAFSDAGMDDSARVYAAHRDRAWAGAEPAFLAQLNEAAATIPSTRVARQTTRR